MKIALSWLKEYVALPKKESELTHALSMAGHMLDKVEIKDNERIIDLELRGNRADCYSILGIAREVSALFNTKVKYPPAVEVKTIAKIKNVELKVTSDLVKRVGMIEINNVKITKSPDWIVKKLKTYGIESVNNIVDLTNYVMIETGEPMHTFDKDKIGGSLEIRLAKTGEKITTFQDTTLTLTGEDLVWVKNGNILSVAGAIGEKYHSISDSTKNVLLEAANYDRANIRKTVYRHNLLTEAGIRHEKELDPNMVNLAISRFLYIVKKYGWGEFTPEISDYYPKIAKSLNLRFDLNLFYSLSGFLIETTVVKKILKSLNFNILKTSKDFLELEIPTYRTDISCQEDITEEVLRIYGYDKIPVHTLSLEIPQNITPDYIKQEEILRNAAVSQGFDEMITSSFVKEDFAPYNKHPEMFDLLPVSVLNPPSPDIKNMRQNLFANLFEIAGRMINEREEEIRLFEIGKVYSKIKSKYRENRKIAFIYWKRENADFKLFKGKLQAFFDKIHIEKPKYVSEIKNIELNNSYGIKIDNIQIGFGGECDEIYFAEIDLDKILGKEKRYTSSLYPKYPPQIEDITITLPEKTLIGEVSDSIKNTNKLIENIELKDIFKDSYTFRIWYRDQNKSLNDREVEKIRRNVIQVIKNKFGGVIKT